MKYDKVRASKFFQVTNDVLSYLIFAAAMEHLKETKENWVNHLESRLSTATVYSITATVYSITSRSWLRDAESHEH